jgi:hypothetical protein
MYRLGQIVAMLFWLVILGKVIAVGYARVRYGPQKERWQYWFNQGWYAAHGQPHVQTSKGKAYQMFHQGWNSAQAAISRKAPGDGQGPTVHTPDSGGDRAIAPTHSH